MAGPQQPHPTPPTVRIVTESAAHFSRSFAGAYRGGMLFLRNPKPLAVGRRVRVEVSTRAGESLVSGDGVVSEVVEPAEGGPANRITFTTIERGRDVLERLAMFRPSLSPSASPLGGAKGNDAPVPAPERRPTLAPRGVPPPPASAPPVATKVVAAPPPVPPEEVPVQTVTSLMRELGKPKTMPTLSREELLGRGPANPGVPPSPLPPTASPPPTQDAAPAPPPAGPPPAVLVSTEPPTLEWTIPGLQPEPVVAAPPPPLLALSPADLEPLADDAWAIRPPSFQFPDLQGRTSARMIGIDLGTAFSCAAYVADGKPRVIPDEHGRRSFPSSVWADGTRSLVGEPAMDSIERDPKNVIHSWKRLVGRDFESEAVQDALEHFAYQVEPGPDGEAAVRIGELLCHPSWFAARVLYEIRRRALSHLSEVIESAVITVPAHYTDKQRADIRLASRFAGFKTVRLITEPVAAAIAYGVSRDEGEQTLLTYDFGGGTFDVSVLELDGRVFQVAATGGDPFLGGVDFDDRIMGCILLEFFKREGINLGGDFATMVRVAAAAERAKRELSERTEVRIAIPFVAMREGKGVTLDVTLTRAKLDELCGDLVQRTLVACDATLAQAGLGVADLDEVVLVGGMTRVPLVHRRVEEHFLRSPRKGVHADEAVALGAAIFADSLGRDAGLAILDVVAMGVGVRGPDGSAFVPVIPARASLPVTRTHVIRAEASGQTAFQADVFQGTSTMVSMCEYLGSIEVSGLPPAEKGAILAEVQFRMTEDGTLALAMRDRSSSGFRRLGLRYQASKARVRKASPRSDARGLAYLRKLLGGR